MYVIIGKEKISRQKHTDWTEKYLPMLLEKILRPKICTKIILNKFGLFLSADNWEKISRPKQSTQIIYNNTAKACSSHCLHPLSWYLRELPYGLTEARKKEKKRSRQTQSSQIIFDNATLPKLALTWILMPTSLRGLRQIGSTGRGTLLWVNHSRKLRSWQSQLQLKAVKHLPFSWPTIV